MLDTVPVATPTFLVGTALVIYAYVTGDLTVFQAFVALGFTGLGSGGIGHARNGAGRGVRR